MHKQFWSGNLKNRDEIGRGLDGTETLKSILKKQITKVRAGIRIQDWDQ
jgi:hypothetical protein